jgi:bacillithiol system protein YtxJ
MIRIDTVEQLQSFLGENPNSAILKHSTSCPISTKAHREFTSFSSNASCPTAIVLVIEARPVSNHLAEVTGVTHKSPQVLFFRNRECYKDFSHYDITADNIQAAM